MRLLRLRDTALNEHDARALRRADVQIVCVRSRRRESSGDRRNFAHDFELGPLNRVVRFELAQAGFDPHDQHQMREPAKTGRLGAAAPHVENRAALDSRAGAHRAFIGSRGKHSHTGKTMRHAVAGLAHRPQYAGKDLRRAAELDSRLHHVANAGHAHGLARRHNVEFGILDARILQHLPNQIVAVDFEQPVVIAVRRTDTNSAHGKFCYLKLHG